MAKNKIEGMVMATRVNMAKQNLMINQWMGQIQTTHQLVLLSLAFVTVAPFRSVFWVWGISWSIVLALCTSWCVFWIWPIHWFIIRFCFAMLTLVVFTIHSILLAKNKIE
jgi:hypothetical protein